MKPFRFATEQALFLDGEGVGQNVQGFQVFFAKRPPSAVLRSQPSKPKIVNDTYAGSFLEEGMSRRCSSGPESGFPYLSLVNPKVRRRSMSPAITRWIGHASDRHDAHLLSRRPGRWREGRPSWEMEVLNQAKNQLKSFRIFACAQPLWGKVGAVLSHRRKRRGTRPRPSSYLDRLFGLPAYLPMM